MTAYELQHCPRVTPYRKNECCPRCRNAKIEDFELSEDRFNESQQNTWIGPVSQINTELTSFDSGPQGVNAPWNCGYRLLDPRGVGHYINCYVRDSACILTQV